MANGTKTRWNLYEYTLISWNTEPRMGPKFVPWFALLYVTAHALTFCLSRMSWNGGSFESDGTNGDCALPTTNPNSIVTVPSTLFPSFSFIFNKHFYLFLLGILATATHFVWIARRLITSEFVAQLNPLPPLESANLSNVTKKVRAPFFLTPGGFFCSLSTDWRQCKLLNNVIWDLRKSCPAVFRVAGWFIHCTGMQILHKLYTRRWMSDVRRDPKTSQSGTPSMRPPNAVCNMIYRPSSTDRKSVV